ncbi:capsule assembly Wzi family protein [Thermodesulfovibrionales bacterium]|nr:capsule assembly Wzi family protein [Thermodesulfovibrionales bacterium]
MTNHPDTLPDSDSRCGRGAVRRLLAVVAVLCLFAFVPCAWAVNVSVGDEIYDILLRLEADGVIQSGLLTTKPLSRREVARLVAEAERNVKDRSLFLRQLVGTLKRKFDAERDGIKYLKPIDKVYIGFIYSNQVDHELNYNNDGDIYEDGLNLRLGFSSKADLGRFSFYLNPEFRYSKNDKDLVLKRAYGILRLWGLELMAGKDSQWWGPGHHGAILLSNNAEPLTMLKLTNPHPTLLPWVFRHLGPFRFVFFASRLEEERHIPEPYLWGLRLNFKPSPYTEIGLSRTALLGGEGQPEDLSTWWKSFTGADKGIELGQVGDHRAGGDIRITLPFRVQPLQLYFEAAGEDEAGGLPSLWAYLAGIYLPRIFTLERLSFRAEYANTYVPNRPGVWYGHSIYLSRYTYKGRVIGHHMDTDARDLFFELSYLLPELNGRLRVSYNREEREEHNLSATQKSTKDAVSVNARFSIRDNMSVEGRYTFGELRGEVEEDISLFTLNMTYRF